MTSPYAAEPCAPACEPLATPQVELVDVLLTLAAALFCAAVLVALWLSADGRYAAEPSLVTPQTVAPAVIFDGEEP